MSTITDGTTVFTPRTILGWSHSRRARTVVHDIIGRGDPDYSLQPAGTRAGQLRILCDDFAHATECDELHARAAVFTLTNTDNPDASGLYVVDGETTFDLDEETLVRCVLVVPFREVLS